MLSAFKGSRFQAGTHVTTRWAPHALTKRSGDGEPIQCIKSLSAIALGKRPANSSPSRDFVFKKGELKKSRVLCSEEV
ncbi:hypothetical protein BGZ47_002462, partial [Haplosporangium gracile]